MNEFIISKLDLYSSVPNNYFKFLMLQTEPSNQPRQVSLNIIKDNNLSIISNEEIDSDEDHSTQQLVIRNKYGNMKVLLDGIIFISLGPDYLCFLPTFMAFCITSYFLMVLVFATTSNSLYRLITTVMCVGQPLSYLIVALSNPGVVYKSADHLQQSDKKKCSKCILIVPSNSRHCNQCDICVQQYDHHCPWTSKCIGGKNLVQFYIFLGWTPIYLMFIAIAFVACMGSNLNQMGKQKN